MLSVLKQGSGEGRVVSSPAGIDCGASCAARFAAGTVITLSGAAEPTSEFVGFSGGGCSGPAPCTLTLNRAQEVVAVFNRRPRFSLRVLKTGEGSVTGAGIDCGSDCEESLVQNDTVTLTAQPAPSFRFVNWSGACSGTDSCTVTLSEDTSVTAHFAAVPPAPPAPVELRVLKQGSGAGRVVSDPAGIDCGGSCAAQFAAGATVTLTGSAEPGSEFAGFSGGGCAGSAPCTLRLDRAQEVIAVFARKVTLRVLKTGEGLVTGAGIACGADCEESYFQNEMVTLTAQPAASYRFANWSGACSGTGNCAMTLTEDAAVTAQFVFAPPAPVGSLFGGDMHVHTDHSADGSGPRQASGEQLPGNVTVTDQINQGVLNGLDWMPITDHRTYAQHYDPLWESSDLLLIPGEEANGSPHANVFGALDTVVQNARPPGDPGQARLQQSIWDAHSQGAVWQHNHPDDGHMNGDDTPNANASALGADLVEVWNKVSHIDRELIYVENRWNAGFRFGVTGASDSHIKELWAGSAPGLPVTRVFAGTLNERALLQGLAAGRTVLSPRVSGAPLLTLEADLQNDGVFEAIAGDEVVAPSGTAGRVRVRVQNGASTTVSLYRAPGRASGAAATFTPTQPDQTFTHDFTTGGAPTWFYAEARGPGEVDAVDSSDYASNANTQNGNDERRAITSAIFIGPRLAEPEPAIAQPSDAGVADNAALVFGAAKEFSGFPDIAASGDLAHLVAERHSVGRTGVTYRRVNADGSLSEALDLTPASASARFPRVAARGATVWVAWADERGGQLPRRSAIYLRESRDGGASWQAEIRLREIAGRAERPALGLMPDGKPVVAWQEISNANPFDVMAQIVGVDAAPVNVSRTGKTISAGTPEDSRSPRYPASVWPALAVSPGGRIALAYHDNRTDPDPLWTGRTGAEGTEFDNWQVRVHTRAPGAPAYGAAVPLGQNDRAERHPSLVFLDEQKLLAAWDSKTLDPSGVNQRIDAALSSDGGASFAAVEVLAAQTSASGQYPRLGLDAGGRARAVWYDNRSADWRWRVATARFDGATWDAGQLLLSPGINTWPATDGGRIVFASTRNAQRMQRDSTQQIFLVSP